MSRWFRSYVGTVTDPKFGEVAFIADCSLSVVIATWQALLEDCAENADAGCYTTSARRISVILREPIATIEAILAAMTEIGLVADGRVTAWSRRQYESDSSTERSRKHRETKRNGNATLHHGTATLQKQHATPPEADTDTESEYITGISTHTMSPREPDVRAGPANDPITETRKRVVEAYNAAGALPPDMNRVTVWIKNGYTAEEIICCISDIVSRGKAPSSLKYFDKPLEEMRAAPRAPPHGSIIDETGNPTPQNRNRAQRHDQHLPRSGFEIAADIITAQRAAQQRQGGGADQGFGAGLNDIFAQEPAG